MAPKGKQKPLVLLDAHAIIHRAYHALPQFQTSTGEPTGALFGIVSMLFSIMKELQPFEVAAAFDLPKPTHRHEVFADYKATRKKAEEDLVIQIKQARELFAAFGIPIYEAEGFEADDILGTIVAQQKEAPYPIIIASGDMDTLQLVDDRRVMVYTLRRSLKETVLYDEAAVVERFGFAPHLLPDYKGLCGDTSDNIPGVSGIGEKTAQKLVSTFGDLDAIYAALEQNDPKLKEIGITPRQQKLLLDGKDEAYFSRMLATIRTDAPIRFQLPETPWQERLDCGAILSLFARWEFRQFPARLATFFPQCQQQEAQKPANIDESLLKEAAVKLWLVKSDITDPSLQDILQFTRSRSLPEANAVLDRLIKERNLTYVWEYIEKPLIPVIERMNQTGVLIDQAFFKELSREMHEQLSAVEKEIYAKAGETFNIRSPKQLGQILFEKLGIKPPRHKKTSTGQYSTAEDVLEKIAEAHPIVPLILRYRELHKLLSTYIDPLPQMVDANGRLHTEFVQTGTTTGRLSSRNPNLQNIPVKTPEGKRIREGFIAPNGFQLLSLDYSQIELRIAAILSGDRHLKEVFIRGGDIHAAVAAKIFGVSEEEVTPEMRRRAKVINFGILYGMGVHALRRNLGEGTTLQEAREYLNAYFETFAELAAWIEKTKAEAARLGYTETLFGRRRYFEGIHSSISYVRAAAERMAINAPIQGTQADIIKRAMVEADAYLEKQKLRQKAKLILQVHDEIIFEVSKQVLPEVAEAVKNIMESVLSEEKRQGVPIVADVQAGDNWGALVPLHAIMKKS